VQLHELQFRRSRRRSDAARFDVLIHLANEKKMQAEVFVHYTIWKNMDARHEMGLTRVEREKITDTVLKIHPPAACWEEFDETQIPQVEGVQDCLKSADKNVRLALRMGPSPNYIKVPAEHFLQHKLM